jgi:hypothetical protein
MDDATRNVLIVRKSATWVVWPMLALVFVLVSGDGRAQAGAQRTAGTATTPRAAAPKDFTGYWASVVTEQWHLRMLMPPKGEYSMLPLNAQARAVANMWTPAQDAGNECRAYGAAAIMRVPGRLHIHWADDNTLQIDTDSGTQTRQLHFEGNSAQKPVDAQPQWQGYSIASWAGTPIGRGAKVPGPAGDMMVVTTQMKAGYLRKNGVPYSDRAVQTEYMNYVAGQKNDEYLVDTAMVDDPVYLNGPFIRTYTFKKEADGSKWDPTPCWNR